MRLLVTGATGFIGGAIARRLRDEGSEVVVLVRDPARLGADARGLEPVVGDLAGESGLASAGPVLAGVEAVVHAAALRKDWGVDPALLIAANVDGTRRLMRATRGCRRFVHLSSVGVYGHPSQTPVSETSAMLPKTPYGHAKLAAERVVGEESAALKLPATIVRPVITYGPGDTYGMVPQLLRLLRRRRYLLVGKGNNRVHLSHIDDLVDGVLLALAKPEAAGEDFILCGPDPITMGRLAALAAAAVGRRVPRLRAPERLARLVAAAVEPAWRLVGLSGEPVVTRGKIDIVCRDRAFSCDKARRLLGYSPRWNYEAGIPTAARWLEKNELL